VRLCDKDGGMPERSIGAVLKTARASKGDPRGFESLSRRGTRPLARACPSPARLSTAIRTLTTSEAMRRSAWLPVMEAILDAAGQAGLYRIRRRAAAELIYSGQGRIAARLRAHVAKATAMHRQADAFGGLLEASYVAGIWAPAQRLELENDLIAGYVLRHGAPPPAQFLG
jgi:hypothetical protein